jgi:hypothetical protein
MAHDALLEEIEDYFAGNIPPKWHKLMNAFDSRKLEWEWYEFRHPSPHTL